MVQTGEVEYLEQLEQVLDVEAPATISPAYSVTPSVDQPIDFVDSGEICITSTFPGVPVSLYFPFGYHADDGGVSRPCGQFMFIVLQPSFAFYVGRSFLFVFGKLLCGSSLLSSLPKPGP